MNRKLASWINSKTIALAAVLAIALGVAALLAFRGVLGTSAQAASNSLEGVWIVTVNMPVAPQPIFTCVTAFHRDGSLTMMENDARPGIGVWNKVSGRSYAWTAWEYWKQGDTFMQAKMSGPIELGKSGDEYSGPFSLQLFVVGNPNPVLEGEGSATAVRMPK